MKGRFRIAAAALVAACVMVMSGCLVADKLDEARAHVVTLKEKGCDALTEDQRELLVALIKTRFENYPDNGICDPDWVNGVLVEQLRELTDESGVSDGSASVGHSADSGHGQVDQSGAAYVLLSNEWQDGNGASGIRDGSGVDTAVGAFVHAPGVEAYSGSGGNTRLLLHASMQQHDAQAGGSVVAGSHGACSNACASMEAAGGFRGSASWRSRQMVA
ncbi:MAG: hypothetical protein OIF55_14610 [Amphritea sp.]|nr:hypothetical protein [Amphritea sp.]